MKAGDWEDFPEFGRTLYLGASTSAVKARMYEKESSPNTCTWANRIGVGLVASQASQRGQEAFATLSPSEVWGASKWSRALAARSSTNISAHTRAPPRLSERDKALSWMVKQYGHHLVGLASDLGGWECVGLTLSEIIKDQAKEDEPVRLRGVHPSAWWPIGVALRASPSAWWRSWFARVLAFLARVLLVVYRLLSAVKSLLRLPA